MPTTVMIGEKPKVASKLANALGNYSVEENRGVKNYVIETDQGELIIAPAVGHIFNLEEQEDGWDYPVFDVEWEPIFQNDDNADYVEKYYRNLQEQLKKADRYINACDYDVEGCLVPSEKVLVKRDETIEIVSVGSLVNEIIENSETSMDGEFEFAKSEIKIAGMSDWDTDFVDVEKVMRRPAEDSYLEITTFNNRRINVSKNHPMLVSTERGLESRKAEQIEEGDHVLASRGIQSNQEVVELDLIDRLDDVYVHGFKKDMDIMPAEMCEHVDKTRKQCLNYRHNDRMPKSIFKKLEPYLGVERENLEVSSPRGSTRLPAILPLNRKLGRVAGLYLAEGCIDSGGFVGFYFGPDEDGLVEEVLEYLEFIGTEGKVRKRKVEGAYGESECYEVGTKSRIFRKLIEELELGEESEEKRLPSWILSAKKDFKHGVLSGYWDGDGSLFVDKTDERALASVTSKSSGLLDDLFYLLQTLEINPARTGEKYDRSVANLMVGRKEEFKKLIEVVDTNEEFKKALEETKIDASHQKMQRVPKELLSQKDEPNRGSKTVVEQDVDSWTEELEGYSEGDTTFLKVRNIEVKQSNADYFYDFQTTSKNFMHGNGIITHNSTIGGTILKQIAEAEDNRIKRMKFSTLTPSELKDAFDDLEDYDKGMTEAGITRHTLDFFYGVNVSRALMQAVRENDRYKTLSTGRVQGPTLKVLADKEREIREFEPEDYWELYLQHSEFDAQLQYGEENRIWDEDEAQGIFLTVKDEEETEVADIDVNNYKHKPPIPFNLTGLQSEASTQFNISPKKTQSIAQTLYENSLISYPRTESQKLPPKIGYKNILNKLKSQDKYEENAEKVLGKDNLSTTQGKKEDDAHPAIYPTGQSPGGSLSKQERKIYDLIVKRFFAVFGDSAKRRTLTMTLTVEDYDFQAKSKVTVERNWFELYDPYVKVSEAELPDLEEDETLEIEGFDLKDKETKPPRRYSQSRIVNKLEKKNLGTKSTRAKTIDRLYNRNYIENSPIEVTDLGLAIIDTLEDHCPNVLSEELTREFEEKMDSIRGGDETSDEVIADAKDELTEILEEFKHKEKEIGAELVDTIDEERKRRRTLGPCGVCEEEGREDGKLRIIKNSGSSFVGCSNYPDCENTYPLPNSGKINSTDKECDECGKPVIYVERDSRKSYSMCVDPDCPSKDDW